MRGRGKEKEVGSGTTCGEQRKKHKSMGALQKGCCKGRSYQEGVSHVSLERTFFHSFRV
jgi:hypothetical protein